jgi:diguanylate cyclase (GGDEF)-like protein
MAEPWHTLVQPIVFERWATRWVRRRDPATVVAVSMGLIAAVGALDLVVAVHSGFDFAATLFYVLPIGLAAWAAGRNAGWAVATFAALVEAGSTWAAAQGDLRLGYLAVSVALELMVFLGAAHVMAQLRRYLDQERQVSRTDPLVGIGNTRFFREMAGHELARAQRTGAPISLAYFDVDDFKQVNDQRGHRAGDALLGTVAATLRDALRGSDYAARVGGDEFAVLLPDTDADAARQAVERLRVKLASELARAGFTQTVSVGVATYVHPPAALDDLVGAADEAMYQVKRTAKGGLHQQVVVPPPRLELVS